MQISSQNTVTEEERELCLKQLSITRTFLLTKPKATFFIALILRLPVIITNEIATLATNGISVLVNPNFWNSLTKDERLFIYLHEILHVIYDHPNRTGTRHPRVWNIAVDYVVNYILSCAGFPVPEQALFDEQYADMSAEQVYDLLMDNADIINKPMPKLFLDDLVPVDSTDSNQDSSAIERSANIQRLLVDAATQATIASGIGSVPKDIQRLIDLMTKPKLNWKVILRRLTFSLSKCDVNWSRPNRRYLPMYLPQRKSKTIGSIDFAIDTSGSVSQKMFNEFCSEVFGAIKAVNPKDIRLIQFDCIIQNVDKIKNIRDLSQVTFSGGGGTVVDPVIELFKASDSKALIILTDGGFRNTFEDPKRPVIWVIYDNLDWKPPFGSVVYLPE